MIVYTLSIDLMYNAFNFEYYILHIQICDRIVIAVNYRI